MQVSWYNARSLSDISAIPSSNTSLLAFLVSQIEEIMDIIYWKKVLDLFYINRSLKPSWVIEEKITSRPYFRLLKFWYTETC